MIPSPGTGSSSGSFRTGHRRTKLLRRHMRLIFAGLLGTGVAHTFVPCAQAQEIELGSLKGFGIKVSGVPGSDFGSSVSDAGDVNGDGVDDFIVGAPSTGFASLQSGSAYVIFGKRENGLAGLDLSSLNSNDGLRIDGVAGSLMTGLSVSKAGDFNNDGFDDLLIGCPYFSRDDSELDRSYVVFGKAAFTSSSLSLAALDGTNGFQIIGESALSSLGRSLSAAGDVNNDGFDDVILGALGDTGSSYIIFGKAVQTAADFNLANLDGTNGIRIRNASMPYYRLGCSVSGAGDVNNDGFDDVIIGARNEVVDPGDHARGNAYVVFGKASFSTATLEVANLDGTNGFRIKGAAGKDYCGLCVSKAGDVNGDGFADVFVCSAFFNNTYYAGTSLVFGKATFTTSTLELASLDGSNGINFNGIQFHPSLGKCVSDAGDVNGDGFADLFIGHFADASTANFSGSSYLIFGQPSFTTSTLKLSEFDGSKGLKFKGAMNGEYSGYNVSAAGDVNGDGIPDLLIGAQGSRENGIRTGACYVIFGPQPLNVSRTKVSLDFAETGRDSILTKGRVRLSKNFDPLGQVAVLTVGGISKSFTLNRQGYARVGQDFLKFRLKKTKRAVTPFTALFKNGDFATSLSDEGLINSTLSHVPVTIDVLLTMPETVYGAAVVPQVYTATQDRSGQTN